MEVALTSLTASSERRWSHSYSVNFPFCIQNPFFWVRCQFRLYLIIEISLRRTGSISKYDNITAEQMIGSRYADFVIKDKNEELFFVKIKQIWLKLKETHLNQARQYAVDEGIDCAILANGDDWQIYRTLLEGKIPVTKSVFSFKISYEFSSPKNKTDLMYYLTEEASLKKEIEDSYWYRVALSGEYLAKHILSDPVINKLRIELNKSTKQHLKNYDIAEALQKRLFTSSIDSEECERRTERLKRLKS